MNLSDLLKRVSEEDRRKMFVFRGDDGGWSNVDFEVNENEITVTFDTNEIFTSDK